MYAPEQNLLQYCIPSKFYIVLFFSQIVAANEEAYKLFDCSELIGKKLSCILKKTSQVLEDALEENVPLVDGTVAVVTGKVV